MKIIIVGLIGVLLSGCAVSRTYEKRELAIREQRLIDELQMNPDKYSDHQVKEMIKEIHDCKIKMWAYEQEEKKSQADVYNFWH